MASESYLPLKISVVIPVYNEQENLGKCLEAVYRSKYPPCEVIVVDDCSTDNSLAVAGRFPCRVVKLEEKHGAAKAKNCGAEKVRGDVIFFTDADILLDGDTLSLVVEDFADPQISGVVGLLGKEVRYNNFCSEYKNLWMHYTYIRLPPYIGIFYTSVAAIRRSVFQEHRGFNENYQGASITEDAEFGQRLLTAGHKIYLDKRLTVKHLKHYSLIELIKTDFWRSYGLTKTMLRNKFGRARQKSFTSVPWFFILGVFISSLTMFLLLLSIIGRDYRFLIAALIGCATTVLLNIPFLNFLRKTRGWSFLGKSCGFLLVDTLVVVLGVLFAVASFIVGKRF
jgi:glycosyltransferase involved in cell wall biosynthesis